MKVFVIVPSGGKGLRAGYDIPKQYVKVKGKEVLLYTLENLSKSDMIDEIIIPADAEYFEVIKNITKNLNIESITKCVEGGTERMFSVLNGLNSIICDDDDIIIVHDAARPLVSEDIVRNVINSTLEYNAVVTAIIARDSLFKGNYFVSEYVDRLGMFYAQTPQAFRFNILREAFDKALIEGILATDEATLVKNCGYNVKIIEGSSINFKLTTKEDYLLFEKLVN